MPPSSSESTVVVDTRRSPACRLRPVPLGAVRIADDFWAPRIRTVRTTSLADQYEQCERTGRIDNFRRAAGRKGGDFQGRFYNDSDVYKWLEAASFALAGEPDPILERRVDGLVAEIASAKAANGYLNTYFTFDREGERWTDLAVKHEMYCAGHLIQAAIAHRRATGKRALLDVATRLADHLCQMFGPDARPGVDGHEEIELALVELYRETGNRTYLDRAGFFLDQRGQIPPLLGGSAYLQDHAPVRAQDEIVGHAVRAAYLACGMADVFAETGEPALGQALERLWRSAFERKAYVTGGLGARWQGEAFGVDYELPNDTAYAETCAAIGGVMWNWRNLQRTGEARFADWLETGLYNGVLAGLGLSGTEYFYQNPLADRGEHRREPWFSTACCPPNLARLLLSLSGYVCSTSDEGLLIHLYAAGSLRADLPGGSISLRIETHYPWEGEVRLVVEEAPSEPLSLLLRLPGWCERPSLTVGGNPLDADLTPGSYAAVRRVWRPGDVVELGLPMPVRQLASHPRVLANSGRVALRRGPLIYCVEGADHPGVDVWNLELPADAGLTPEWKPELLGGVVALRGEAAVAEEPGWDGALYRFADDARASLRPAQLTAIPYCVWANRAPGPMQVWIRASKLSS